MATKRYGGLMANLNFFLNVQGGFVLLDLIEITHPDLYMPMRFVRNDKFGVAVKHEDGVMYNYEYQLFSIKRSATNRTLDQEISITFADFNDSLMNTLKRTNRLIEPQFKYRQYRDDDLYNAVQVLQTLEITNISKDASGFVTFDAKAVQLNNVKTGEVYTVENCPLLRGT